MFEHKIFTMELAGRELSVEIGKIAQLASGSAILKYGETMVMVNVSKSAEPREVLNTKRDYIQLVKYQVDS